MEKTDTDSRNEYGRPIPVIISFMMIFLSLWGMIFLEDMAALTISEGTISEDTRWTVSDSPVYINNNITLESGYELIIDPGVRVLILKDRWMDIQGSLVAKGTEDLPVEFNHQGTPSFSRINISNGGRAIMEHCMINSSEPVRIKDSDSELRIYNSTLDTGSRGLATETGATVWAINCTFLTDQNVTMTGGIIHEGNWFNIKAIKKISRDPLKDVNIEIIATVALPPPYQGFSWTVYDSVEFPQINPPTGADGTVPPIPVEQYLHNGSVSTTRAVVQVLLVLEVNNTQRAKTIFPVYMGSDQGYVWELDFTPPPAPTNLSVINKGGSFIRVGWDFDGDPAEVKFFIISYKKWWETDENAWDIQEPGPSARDWNISSENPPNPGGGLIEEMEYDIKISCIDYSDNPSDVTGPIRVKTLDVTPPEAPYYLRSLETGGHHTLIQWNRSVSEDTIGYDIFINDSSQSPMELDYIESTGEPQQTFNLTGLADETSYSIWIAARDDGEIPNLSNLAGPLKIRTLDITPPVAPILDLLFIDPDQYISGSGLYNNTQVGLSGFVEGENRTFVDVFVDGKMYVNQNPDLPRPATNQGSFFFFISVDEGYHSIKVRSVDSSGNEGDFSEEVSVTIDLDLPEIGIVIPEDRVIETQPGSQLTLDSEPNDENGIDAVIWNISGPDNTYEIRQGYELEMEYDEGLYKVKLMVIDMAGNINTTSFNVLSRPADNTLPELEVIAPEGSVNLDHAPVFKIRFSEPVMWELLDAAVYSDDMTERIELVAEKDEENLTITYQLTDSLKGGRNYSLRITSIFDMRENAGDDFIYEFSTIEDEMIDSDGDGIPDHIEVQKSFLNPSDPNDAGLDYDNDGLTNLEEYLLGTDMESRDTDGDGMDDGWEVEHGLSPTDKSDALQDLDGDGYTNLEEYYANTDPRDPEDKPSVDEGSDNTMLILLAIIVVMIMIIASVVIFVISRKKKSEEEEDIEDDQETGMRSWGEEERSNVSECPSCGSSIEKGLDYCPMCGESIPLEEDISSGNIDVPIDEEAEMNEEALEDSEETLFDEPPVPVIPETDIPDEIDRTPEPEEESIGNEPPR